MKLLSYLFTVSLLLGLLCSCSDDNDGDNKSEGIAVKSVTATSCIDLSDRKDWNIRFGYAWAGGIFYNFKVDGKNISADSPKKDSYRFDERSKEGEKAGIYTTTYLRFVPEGYFPMDNSGLKSTEPIPPAIQDQSTFEKLIKADALFCNYEGIVTPNMKDVKFIHENILLEFETINIPENAEIRITGSSGNFAIIPYKASTNNYKAISLPKISGATNYIVVKVGEESYNLGFNYSLAEDLHYVFKLRLDNNKLIIEDLIGTVWSEDGEVLTKN